MSRLHAADIHCVFQNLAFLGGTLGGVVDDRLTRANDSSSEVLSAVMCTTLQQ
jgi:acetyl-CoA carboxylase beta subunit